jgi:hypothetical protein
MDSPELLVSENSLSKNRKRKVTREICNARIVFKRTIKGKYEVSKFYEGHSHGLVTPRKKQFLRSARSVNSVHKNIFLSYGRANVSTSTSFKIMKEQVGSYENIGCTQRDLQNYSRNLK